MKTINISGIGGGYEYACQKMLQNGLKFLEAHPYFDPAYKSYSNIFGICIPENEESKEFDKALMEGVEDVTGAMHQVVIGHLLYIHLHSLKAWLEECKDTPGRIFEFDGTEESCPGLEPELEEFLRGFGKKSNVEV